MSKEQFWSKMNSPDVVLKEHLAMQLANHALTYCPIATAIGANGDKSIHWFTWAQYATDSGIHEVNLWKLDTKVTVNFAEDDVAAQVRWNIGNVRYATIFNLIAFYTQEF